MTRLMGETGQAMDASSQPLVSVVIPAYNASSLISTTLDSAIHQTYKNIEILVIDDGSTDNTAEIVSSYGDPVRLIKQKNSGPGAARNTGIKEAHGSFIAFLDADDIWHPEKTRLQVQFLVSNTNFGAVFCEWIAGSSVDFSKTGVPEEPKLVFFDNGWIYHHLLLDPIIHTSTIMIRKELLKTFDSVFPTEHYTGEDYELWLKLSQITQIAKIDFPLSFYRIHSDSITASPSEQPVELLVINNALEKWGRCGPDGQCIPQNMINDRLSGLWSSYSYGQFKSGNASAAVNAAFEALKIRPWKLRNWKLLAGSLFKLAFYSSDK